MVDDDPRRSRLILLVDSDPAGREALRGGLSATDLEFLEAQTLADARAAITRHRPDLVMCEIELTDGSGFALARVLRDDETLASKPVVLLISRWTSEADRILGFECGADDFVTRPFYMRELASRIRALLRRGPATVELEDSPTPGASAASGLVLDPDRQAVWIGTERVPLTLRELAILTALCENSGRVVPREDLIDQVYGDGRAPSKRSVDAHIKGLRQKLGDARSCIETVRGRGYRYSGGVQSARSESAA